MTENKVIEVIKNEKECVLRNINGCDRNCGKCDLVMEDSIIINAYDSAIMALSEIQKYQAIGTVEECRAAMEKQRAKKPIKIAPCKSVNYFKCSSCGNFLSIDKPFCEECGSAVDWSE